MRTPFAHLHRSAMERPAVIGVVIFILIQGSSAAVCQTPFAIPAANPVIGVIFPDPAFRHGMLIDELEPLIRLSYAGWAREERTRPINNQSSSDVPQDARKPYLQSVLITKTDTDKGISQKYTFVLTSPLSKSAIYSIVYEVESLDRLKPLMPLQKWLDAYYFTYSRLSSSNDATRSDSRASVSYSFDSGGKLIDSRKCDPLYRMLYRLDEKTIQEVEEVVRFIGGTDCAYGIDNIVEINDRDEIYKSTLFLVDHAKQVNDVAKRVRFGRQ